MVTIERKGSENPAKSGATGIDQSNLGQAPRETQGSHCCDGKSGWQRSYLATEKHGVLAGIRDQVNRVIELANS